MIRNLENDVSSLSEIGVRTGSINMVDIKNLFGEKGITGIDFETVLSFPYEHSKYVNNLDMVIPYSVKKRVYDMLIDKYYGKYFTTPRFCDPADSIFNPRMMLSLDTDGDFASDCSGSIRHEYSKMIHATPRRIWQTPGGYTTVEWNDGVKTTVKAENEATATMFGGFTAALAKRIFGSTSDVNRAIEEAVKKTEEPKRKKELEAKRRKERKKRRHEAMIQRREVQIQMQMDEERIKREALKRLEKEDEQK